MKKRMLITLASLLIVIGVFLLLAFTIYGWGTWNGVMGGVDWLDLQLANKTQIPFLTKAVVLAIVGGIFWLRGRQLISRAPAARWILLAVLGIALAFGLVGLVLIWIPQADFLYRNESALQTVRTILYILAAVLLIIGSVGAIAGQRGGYWLLIGWFMAGASINFANLIVIVTFPIIISVTGSSGWLTRWGVEALIFLGLNITGLSLLFWTRSEVSNPEEDLGQPTDGRSSLGLT